MTKSESEKQTSRTLEARAKARIEVLRDEIKEIDTSIERLQAARLVKLGELAGLKKLLEDEEAKE